jgi:cbb3-type cytochrome oxidase maturation protein
MLLILVPVTLLLVGFAAWAFLWAADGGQFDDLDSPALAPLLDDLPARKDPPE